MKTSNPLTITDPNALAHHQKLLSYLRQQLAQQGRMSFADFMQQALYAPGLGYYVAGAQKFGAAGDFVTAPEISPWFGRCVAKQCQAILAETGGDILELGAGSGLLAAELLQALAAADSLPEHYYILEVSPELQQRQRLTLQQHCADLLPKVQWLKRLPEGLTGIILGNEVVDALAVAKFQVTADGVKEYYVKWEQGCFAWELAAPTSLGLAEFVTKLDLSLGYSSEYCPWLPAWIKGLGDCLTQGVLLLIDYGFPRHEYYHPDRNQGTLMCHYAHYAHSDPLLLVGLQDITAHVDFTLIAESAVAAGLEVAGYTNQEAFLLSCGLTRLVAASADPEEQWRLAQELKRLTLSSEMGELFKVIALTREVTQDLLGFTLQDRRHQL